MKSPPHKPGTRAEAAERTGARILDAMLARFTELPYDQIRIEDVAADAEVTVQTVLRRFESKPRLMTTVAGRELTAIAATRARAGTDDPSRTLAELVTHYEKYGALILKVYAEARFVTGLPELAAAGRRFHVDWCRRAFAEHLAERADPAGRKRQLAQLVVACDATTWRILRVDLKLDPTQTRLTLQDMVRPLLRSFSS